MTPQRHRAQRSGESANTDCRGHVTNRTSTVAENPEGRDDDQDIQATSNEGLRNHQAENNTRPRQLRDRCECRP
jgi:hypothetical protein